MNVRDVTSRIPAPPAPVLRAIGLAPRESAIRSPSAWGAFGLGLLVGIGIAWLFQAGEDFESEPDPLP